MLEAFGLDRAMANSFHTVRFTGRPSRGAESIGA